MVAKRAKHIKLVVYNYEFNDVRFLTQALAHILGIHYTQAEVCANMITRNGEYVCKTFKHTDMPKARETAKMLNEQEIPTDLIIG
jgi:hypothetical protein